MALNCRPSSFLLFTRWLPLTSFLRGEPCNNIHFSLITFVTPNFYHLFNLPVYQRFKSSQFFFFTLVTLSTQQMCILNCSSSQNTQFMPPSYQMHAHYVSKLFHTTGTHSHHAIQIWWDRAMAGIFLIEQTETLFIASLLSLI